MNQLKIKSFLPLLVLIIVFLFLRFQNIQSIPVFGDEAIYLRWSQLIKNVETLRFVPVSDGKEPLFMWITAAVMKFVKDPLLAGRAVSIFSGVGVLFSIYVLSLLFINPTVAIIASSIYILSPFAFFFDRLALADTLLSFFGLTSVILAIALAKYPRLDLSLLLGFSLGLAWLTKSPAIYFIVLIFITYILVNYKNKKISNIYYPAISALLGFVIYNILRLGPQFQQIALRNQDYVWSLSELIKHPLDPLIPHLKDVVNLYSQLISWPIITFCLIGWIIKPRKKNQNQNYLILLLWWILPLIASAGIAKVFTARYILFTLPPLIILLAVGAESLITRYKISIIVFLICLIPNMVGIYQISTNPYNYVLPSTESGYISGWTSGWGIKSAAQYLIERSRFANIIVGTEGYFGTLPDGLQIYTDSLPRLTVFGVGLDITDIPAKLIDARQHGDEVYLLFNQSRIKLTPTAQDQVDLVLGYDKPSHDKLLLLRLK